MSPMTENAAALSPAAARPLTARQREIFTALLTDFLAEGFESFTIDDATKRYRCSKSTIYALGKTRDAIIRRVLVSFFKEITRRTAPEANRATSAARALEDYFTAMTSALTPASTAFMRDLATEPVAQEVYALNTSGATQTIRTPLERGVAAGEFRAESVAFTSLVIQRTMADIQQGAYTEALPPATAYHALGQLVLHGILER
ncbi:TetR/AcrR family transcriptional regulator [Corynebacterium striatum]|uniref:TetR/AcrR family transcriptional regulator n=1 Tax=Corynebacterium striatum TaxID=43770 RepID=UPI0006689923|nr:TetR/AcrR family transcriptional regulator [Corynebacterium striatum]